MKLFSAYNRLNLLATVAVFLLTTIIFYFFIRSVLIRQVDDDLLIEKKEIETHVREYDRLPEIVPVRHQVIRYRVVAAAFNEMHFRSFVADDSTENDRDNFRGLDFGIRAGGVNYLVSVMKPLESTENLLWSILLITVSVMLLILAVFYGVNRVLLKKLWTPFFDTLGKLKSFSLAKNEPLRFPRTRTTEFSLLNDTLEMTTHKARQDYLVLKEFTENASHEMQTPLAIIQSKLDLLIQDEQLSEKQSHAAQSIYESVDRLSRLNQSLLLSAKIGNRQFAETSLVNLKEKLERKIAAFQELWAGENINVKSSTTEKSLQINNELADILLNNLLSNASKHNLPGGSIEVILNGAGLYIRNTGNGTGLDNTRLYRKFYTEKKGSGNNGLGLAIVKQICDIYGYKIDYSFQDSFHRFSITW